MNNTYQNQVVFQRVLADALSRNSKFAKEFSRISPLLAVHWNSNFPKQLIETAPEKKIKIFLKSSIKEIGDNRNTEEAIIEFVKATGGVLSRPAIRKVQSQWG